MTIKVGLSGFAKDEAAVLGYLLYPYNVELSGEVDGSDLLICRNSFLDSSRPLIRVPTRATPSDYDPPKDCGDGIVDLPSDLIRACSERFEAVLNPRVAFMYKLATRLPFQYNTAPSLMRSHFLRMHNVDLNLLHHLGNETARKILTEAFNVLGFRLQRKNPPSLLITHDVESQKGLRSALSLKAVEDELDVQSTWFLPSDEYPIARHIARDLAEGSTIGSHDVKHDGRLICIREHEELVDRLRKSRAKLEATFEKEVKCFRSPLLQFSGRIVAALSEAGYGFDFSVPCWEPVHPLTMSGFGVESAQAFEIGAIIEFPLTLFQDHQVLVVLGMNTSDAIKLLVDQAKLVRSFDGDIVVLVHPDYSFSQDLSGYRKLLESLLEVQSLVAIDAISMTPKCAFA